MGFFSVILRAVCLSSLLIALSACKNEVRHTSGNSPNYVYMMSEPSDSVKAGDVNRFCPLDDDGQPKCPPGPEMAWRLRNYLRSLDSYRASIELQGGPHRERRLDAVAEARANVERELEAAETRVRAQAEIVDVLNRDFECHILAYDKGQQINFARELSLPECDPLAPADHHRAAELLDRLARVSLPVDAEVMTGRARLFSAVGQIVREITQYKQQLLDLKVLHVEHGRMMVDLIGHPYQREDNTRWLEAYIQKVHKLDRELERLGQPAGTLCPEPACDPQVYRLAEAVTLKPPLDWAFLREGDVVMPPTAYGLSYFSGRYDANGDIRHSLSLGSNREWHWDSEDYVNMLNPEDNTLTFTKIFSRDNITLSIANWEQRTEFPNVLPIFYLFLEARRVVDLLKSLKDNAVARGIRDVQFSKAEGDDDFASVTRVPEGLRLNLKVLQPPGGRSVEAVREQLIKQIPAAIARAGRPL